MKKIFLSLAMMLSTSCFASGFYAGGSLGMSFMETKVTTRVPSAEHHLGGFGVVGGGFAGYNMDFCQCKYDLGIEGFINGNSNSNRFRYEFSDRKVRVSSSYNWGFRVLPGFRLLQQLEAHLIVGYTCADISLKDRNDFDPYYRHFHCSGYQIGGGLTLDLNCHFALRFDGVFNGYSPKRHHHTYVTVGADVNDNHHRVNINDFDTTVSLIYKF